MVVDPGQYTVQKDANILKALEAINNSGFGACIVVGDRQEFLNLLTDGDLRRAILSGTKLSDSVQEIIHISAVTAKDSESREEIVSRFNEMVRHIPILDEEDRVVEVAFSDTRKQISIARPHLSGNELKYVTDAMLSGWVSSKGSYVVEFEKRFSEFSEVKYGVAVSSGTTALELALRSCEVGFGSEVIVPTLTFAASANAVLHVGATPIFVDSEWETWNLDPKDVERKVSARTKAVIAVHLYGQPANLSALREICDRNKLLLIEDAAEAHGATYNGRKVGSIGDVGCFSFYANKIITTGEGGMVLTDNKEIYDRARLLSNHGMTEGKKYWHDTVGFNFRMTNIQAAIGCAQVERVNVFLAEKKNISEWYFDRLIDQTHLILPPNLPGTENIYWCFGVVLLSTKKMTRDDVIRLYSESNIEVNPCFTPLHLMPPYMDVIGSGEFPVAEEIGGKGILLPSYPGLTEDQVDKICSTLINLK